MPLVFSAVTDALEWTVRAGGIRNKQFHRTCHLSAPRLDIIRLDNLVQLFLQHLLAPATSKSYQSAQAHYNHHFVRFNPLPLCQDVCHMAGIQQLHLRQYGVHWHLGEMPLLRAVIQGMKRFQAVLGIAIHRPRLPIMSTRVVHQRLDTIYSRTVFPGI